MLVDNAAFDFIEKLDEQNDEQSLIAAFQALIVSYGFNGFCVGDPMQPRTARDDRLWASTWPEQWLSRFVAQNYISLDPVIYRLLGNSEPFRWSNLRRNANGMSARIMDEAGEFHMDDGFGVPVYSREGGVIGVTMGTEHYEIGKRDEASLHLAAIYFQAKLERFRAGMAEKSDKPRLTPRERECLSWVAAGKTDWETSQILGIAEDTAHEYVQGAIAKLGATTRAQAVALALMNRQIQA